MKKINEFPVAGHPLYGNFKNRFDNAYDLLAKQLQDACIDVELLNEVVDATEQLERLSFIHTLERLMNGDDADFERLEDEVRNGTARSEKSLRSA